MEMFKLEGKNAVPCILNEWIENISKDNMVKKTKIGNVFISTVFLGLNHNYHEGPPILFETMVFGGHCDNLMNRYSTWEEAEKGHDEMIEQVKKHPLFGK